MINEFTLFDAIVDKLMTAVSLNPKDVKLFKAQLKSEAVRIADRFDKAALFGEEFVAESKFMQQQAIHLFELSIKTKRLAPQYQLIITIPLDSIIQKMKYYFKVEDQHFMERISVNEEKQSTYNEELTAINRHYRRAKRLIIIKYTAIVIIFSIIINAAYVYSVRRSFRCPLRSRSPYYLLLAPTLAPGWDWSACDSVETK